MRKAAVSKVKESGGSALPPPPQPRGYNTTKLAAPSTHKVRKSEWEQRRDKGRRSLLPLRLLLPTRETRLVMLGFQFAETLTISQNSVVSIYYRASPD